ncbi:MAG: 30S ribosomal protein S6 [Planctomycetota bacterium]
MSEIIAPSVVPAAEAPPLPVLPLGVRLYECMWLMDASAGREDYNKTLIALKEIVEKSGGSWINGDKWEERRLAYPIKKKKRGLYIISHFSAAPEAIAKIDRNARLFEPILRHIITVDEDGIGTSPPAYVIDDDDFSGYGEGREKRFFSGGGRDRDRGDQGSRSRG